MKNLNKLAIALIISTTLTAGTVMSITDIWDTWENGYPSAEEAKEFQKAMTPEGAPAPGAIPGYLGAESAYRTSHPDEFYDPEHKYGKNASTSTQTTSDSQTSTPTQTTSEATSSTPTTPEPVKTPEAAPTEVTSVETIPEVEKPTVDYSHDFDSLNDKAISALNHFLSDDISDNAYLNIKSSSTENIISGKELNSSENEDIKISFVSDDGVDYEWIFDKYVGPDDASVDLTASISETEISETAKSGETVTASANKVSFAGGTVSDNGCTFRVQTGVSDNEVYVLNKTEEGFDYFTSKRTDKDGFLDLAVTELSIDYYISETDIISEVEKLNKAYAESIATEQATEIEASLAPTEEATEIAQDEKPKSSFPIFPVAGGSVILIGIGAVIYFMKKR